MGDPGHDGPMGDAVAAQLVGHEPHGFPSLTPQEFSEESPRGTPVPAGLDEEVDQVTVFVHGAPQILASLTLQEFSEESPRGTPVPAGLDEEVDQVTVFVRGAPQILALTVDRDEDFVPEPRIAESTLAALQPPGVVGAELPAPLPNGFVRHDDASFGQQILDIPEAQTVSVVQPHGVADDGRRKAMPQVAGSSSRLREALRRVSDPGLVRDDHRPAPPQSRRPPTRQRRPLSSHHRPHAVPSADR